MQRQPAEATNLIDDDRVRVTRLDFAPGAQTDCHGTLVEPGGESRRAMVTAGTTYRRDAGGAQVYNTGDARMSFIEVELKQGGHNGSPR